MFEQQSSYFLRSGISGALDGADTLEVTGDDSDDCTITIVAQILRTYQQMIKLIMK